MENQVNESIQKIRSRNNLSRAKFAKIIGVSVTTIKNWESGTNYPKQKYIKKIAECFGTSVEEIENGGLKTSKIINCDDLNDDLYLAFLQLKQKVSQTAEKHSK